MRRRTRTRPLPPSTATRTRLPARPTHSTVTTSRTRRRGTVGRIIDDEEASLVDLIDNLLEKGVVLNADLILALADVDLIYVRLSALLCAADRILPHLRGSGAPKPPRADRRPVAQKPPRGDRGPVAPKPPRGDRGPVAPKPRSGEGG